MARAFFLSKGGDHAQDPTGAVVTAPWVFDPRATPAERHYVIAHELEDAYVSGLTPEVFNAWGLAARS